MVFFLLVGCGAPTQGISETGRVSILFQLSGDIQSASRAFQDFANWDTMAITFKLVASPQTLLSYEFSQGEVLFLEGDEIVPGEYEISLVARKNTDGSLTGIVFEGSVVHTIQEGENVITVSMYFKDGVLTFEPTINIEDPVDSFLFSLDSPTQDATEITFPANGGNAWLYPSFWQATITALGESGNVVHLSGPYAFEIFPDQRTTIHYSLGTADPEEPTEDGLKVSVRVEMPFVPPVYDLAILENESGTLISWHYIYSFDFFQVFRKDHGSDLYEFLGQVPFSVQPTYSFSFQDSSAGGDNVYEYAINVVSGGKESGSVRKWFQTQRDILVFSEFPEGADRFLSVHPLSEGGAVASSDNSWVYWFDEFGNVTFKKYFSSKIYDISEFPNGDLVFVGEKSEDFYIARITKDGSTTVWEQTLGGRGRDQAISLAVHPEGGVVVVGSTTSHDGDVGTIHGGLDFWIVRIHDDGFYLWGKTFGGTYSERPFSVKISPDRSISVFGDTNSHDFDVQGNHGGSQSFDSWLVKLDANGNLQWQKCLGSPRTEWGHDFVLLPDGGYITLSSSDSDAFPDAHGENDVLLTRLDSNGSILWEKCYGGSRLELGSSVPNVNHILALNQEGTLFMVSGISHSSDGDIQFNYGNSDGWLFIVNQNGTLIWEKTFGSSYSDQIIDIGIKPDGNFLFSGGTFDSGYSGWFAEITLNGVSLE